MADFIPQMITAVATLVAAFGGVMITQRHQRAIAEIERADRRRAELRSHLVEFVVSAREWVSQQELTVFVLWKSSDDDFIALSNSESFARLAELRHTVTLELHHLIGLVGDKRLQDAVYKAHDLWLKTPSTVMGPVTDRARKSDKEAPFEALRAVHELGSVITEVRNAAVPLLRVAIIETEPIKWWQVGRRPAKRREPSAAQAGGPLVPRQDHEKASPGSPLER